jgi:predicted AAA+ superfamily ATPase
MIIGNFNALELRQDKGALWENFLIGERMKKNSYEGNLAKSYFWRTVQQQEIDYVEETAGKITGYEIKWSANAKVKIPRLFKETYNAEIEVLTRENFRIFL